jgi:hypothetical protein
MNTSVQTRFMRSAAVKEKRVGGDVALYVEAHRAIHVPNETARFIWECLAEPLTFGELLLMLTEAFDVPEERLETDLRETLALFLTHDLLVTTAVDDGPDLP